MPDQHGGGTAGIAGLFPGPVEGDLDLIELVQAGEGAQFGVPGRGYQPQLPALVLLDLKSLERFGMHGVHFPSVNSIIEIFLPGGFKNIVRRDGKVVSRRGCRGESDKTDWENGGKT